MPPIVRSSEALAGTGIEVAAGHDARRSKRPRARADWVMAAIVGAAGLAPTLAAIRRGAVVALANKEVLVCAGDLVTAEVRRSGATLLPVDSEHNAIFQVFDFDRIDAIEKIILTASGGPFRTLGRNAMAMMTAVEAVKHPNWSMGAKISVDSATMMNKGLELIEAKHLFGLPAERIEIVVHPQSVIHSLVAYIDGSVLAQLGSPDMRTPIAYTLAWPARMKVAQPAARPGRHRPAHLRGAGSGTVPGAPPGARGADRRRLGADRAQRGQRDGGACLPCRADRLPRHRGHRRSDVGRNSGRPDRQSRRRP